MIQFCIEQILAKSGGSMQGAGGAVSPSLLRWSVPRPVFVNILDTNMNDNNASTSHHII